MPKVHPADLPSAHGSKKLGEIEAGGLRRYEPEGTMSESRFREVWFERFDAAIHAAEKKYALRIKATDLLLYVTAKCLTAKYSAELEVALQEIKARENARREERCRRAWAWEVARREREEREQQQREQQREADARAAAAVATAATASAAKAGVNESGREMAPAAAVGQEMSSTGGSGGAASLLKASKTAGLLDEYVCPITAQIMTDPVCTLDGFTYERKAITEWLRTNDTSPATGARLESKNVIPNITVRCLLRLL